MSAVLEMGTAHGNQEKGPKTEKASTTDSLKKTTETELIGFERKSVEQEQPDTSISYRDDIDGLRAVAVIAVVIYHLNEDWLPGGFMGVDIFFAISGYVVTLSLLKNYERNKSTGVTFSPRAFYSRRVKRLVPSLLVFLIVSFICTAAFIQQWTWYWPDKNNYYASGQHASYGVSNIFFIYGTNTAETNENYFQTVENALPSNMKLNPFLHTWSLGVEEQFYLVYPWIFKIVMVDFDNKKYRGLLILAFFFFISLLLSYNSYLLYAVLPLEGVLHENISFFHPFTRMWEMLSGCVCMVFFHKFKITAKTFPKVSSSRKAGMVFDIITLGCIIASFATPRENISFPFPMALIPVIGSLVFVIGGHVSKPFFNRLLTTKGLVYIGKISYPLYLIHWPVIIFFRWTVGLNRNAGLIVLAVLISIILSVVLYYGVEAPIKNLSLKLKKKGKEHRLIAVLSGFVIAIAVAMCLAQIFNKRKTFSIMPLPDTRNGCYCRYNDDNQKPLHVPTSSVNPASTNVCFFNYDYKKTYTYGGHGWPDMSWHDDGTSIDYDNFTVYDHAKKLLSKRRVLNKPHMYVIGDSLALQNSQTLIRAVSGRYTMSDLYIKKGHIGIFLNIRAPNNLIGALKSLVREGDIVTHSVYLSTTFKIAKELYGDDFWQTYYSQLGSTLGPNVSLVFLGYTAELNQFGMRNVFPDYKDFIHDVEFKEKKSKFNKVFEELTSKDQNGYFFDFSHLAMGKDGKANGLIPGTDTVMYFDKYHFTIEGTYYLWPFFCEWLNANNITKH